MIWALNSSHYRWLEGYAQPLASVGESSRGSFAFGRQGQGKL